MSDVKALDPALLKQYSVDFNADRANLVAANAAVSSGVLAAATDYKGERVLQNDFSIELKQGRVSPISVVRDVVGCLRRLIRCVMS